MLAAGADGGTNASSGVVPEVTRKLFDLLKSGNLQAAMSLQYRLTELFARMLRGSDFPEGFQAGVEIRGFQIGSSRQPSAFLLCNGDSGQSVISNSPSPWTKHYTNRSGRRQLPPGRADRNRQR